MLEKTLERPLDCKEIQPVHPKGDQSCVFIGRTDPEAEPPILWLPHAKSWLIGKDPDAGRDTTEQLNWTELILPQTPLPSRLPYHIEQNCLCYTVGPCWLSILNIAPTFQSWNWYIYANYSMMTELCHLTSCLKLTDFNQFKEWLGDKGSSVQSLSHVWLFATPWTAARQAWLSVTNSRSLLKLMSIESVMPYNHLILCHPLLLPPPVLPIGKPHYGGPWPSKWLSQGYLQNRL